VVLTDHVSLGRGALMDESTLLKVLDFSPLSEAESAAEVDNSVSSPAYPSTAAIDASSPAAARALVARIIKAEPDHTPGGMYELGPQLGAPVANASQMGSEPLALAAGVAAAALLALALTILASVRQRRRELALLKALGLRAGQVRAVIAWQTSTILVIAAAVGVPLGILAGRWAWTSFANSIGVVPSPVVPAASLVAGVAALFVAGNLLAAVPASMAARIAPAATLRTE
jgi:predicted lysophospholipase L1 biosynthesis ABC-type transport system permease subunit